MFFSCSHKNANVRAHCESLRPFIGNPLKNIATCRAVNSIILPTFFCVTLLPQVGEMFIVGGVLYAIDSVTERNTKIRLALDLYRVKLVDVSLTFTNPFRKTTTVGYNHKKQVNWILWTVHDKNGKWSILRAKYFRIWIIDFPRALFIFISQNSFKIGQFLLNYI